MSRFLTFSYYNHSFQISPLSSDSRLWILLRVQWIENWKGQTRKLYEADEEADADDEETKEEEI